MRAPSRHVKSAALLSFLPSAGMVSAGEGEMVMARTRRVKSMAEGTAHYHLISRASNRQFLFRKARTKDKLVELVRKAAEFSGIEPVAT